MYVCTWVSLHDMTYVHTCILVKYIHTYLCMRCMSMYIHTYIFIYTYVDTYICTCTLLLVNLFLPHSIFAAHVFSALPIIHSNIDGIYLDVHTYVCTYTHFCAYMYVHMLIIFVSFVYILLLFALYVCTYE